MDTDSILNRKIHHGHNVKRWRVMMGIKQDILAGKIKVAQQTLSNYEAQEKLDDELLEKIANAMNISVDAIKNFDEEKAINIVSNTFQDASVGSDVTQYNKCTFNPMDKVIELYERMLKDKDEKISSLEQILKEKK